MAAVLGAVTVHASNAADEADVAFDLGNKLVAKRQFEPALAQYFLSYRLVPNHNALFNIAKCFEELKRFEGIGRVAVTTLPEGTKSEVEAALGQPT